MVVTLRTTSPLFEPPFVPKISKTWPSYGPNMVHLKSDVMKRTSYIRHQQLAVLKPANGQKNKQNDYSKYLLEWFP